MGPADALGAEFPGQLGQAERHAFGHSIGPLARCSRRGELVAGGDDLQSRPAIDIQRRDIGAGGGDERARIEDPAGRKQLFAVAQSPKRACGCTALFPDARR